MKKATYEQIKEYTSRIIRVVKSDGTVVYDGPLALPLYYNGTTYSDHLIFAEPQIVNGVPYQLLYLPTLEWRTGTMDPSGYYIYCLGSHTERVRRGPALLYTFIGTPVNPTWTCNHIHIDTTKTRRQIRSDDRLDRLEWASLSAQAKDRTYPKGKSSSIPLTITNIKTGEQRNFNGINEMTDFLGVNTTEYTKVMKKDRIIKGWLVEHDVIINMDGEVWKRLDEKRFLSSYGRLAYETIIGELVEQRSVCESKYRRITVQGVQYAFHRLMVKMFGTVEDIIMLESGYEVDHIDADPRNNRIDNLQVMSREDHMRKTHGKRIRVINDNGESTEYASMRHASRDLGVYPDGRRTNSNGYRMEYIDN
jgi:hypothetical protein